MYRGFFLYRNVVHYITFFLIFESNNIIMGKYKVIHPFFKLSEQKDYNIGDEIELSQEEAQNMAVYVDVTIDEKPIAKKAKK